MSDDKNAPKPFAWAAVALDDSEAVGMFRHKQFAEELCRNEGWELVPLYSQPQPTLTDAEPAAWSLFLNGMRACVISDKADAMRFVGREPKYTLVPLYDHPPQPTLTDTERQAIEFFARLDVGANCNERHAATLRGLLGRTNNEH